MADLVTAKQRVNEAADLCLAAATIADRHTLYLDRRDKTVQPKISGLPATHTVVAPKLVELNNKLGQANKEASDKHDYPKAVALLDEIVNEVAAVDALYKASDAYTNRLGQVQPIATGLTTSSPRKDDPAIGPDIEKVDEALKKAADLAAKDPPEFDKAMPLLEDAALRCEAAEVKKTMKGNTKPNKDDLKKIVDKPGGGALLDEIIKGLDPTTTKQEVLIAAINVRFGVKMKQFEKQGDVNKVAGGEVDKSVQKIYELLTKVPDTHGKDNPKLAKIVRYTKPTGGDDDESADYGDGDINIYTLRTGEGLDYNTQTKPGSDKFKQYFPEGVDPECQQANDDQLYYFDWATLHEVGHAVDDKLGFMRRNKNGADFGAWEDYGGDVMPVARAGAGEHLKPFVPRAQDLDYIAKYLTDEVPNPPPASPDPSKITEWEDALDDVRQWCDGIRVDNGLWWDGQGAIDTAIGDRVYQEAYPSKWNSYQLSARKQGIHGYQFRAPGEWFAELYAAYYCGKLKPGHPAVKNGNGWLPQLEPPQKK